MLARVPEEKLAQWQKVQDQIKAGTYKPDSALIEELQQKIQGQKK